MSQIQLDLALTSKIGNQDSYQQDVLATLIINNMKLSKEKEQELREEFTKNFRVLEVRIPEVEEYHTGPKAHKDILDFWINKINTELERRDCCCWSYKNGINPCQCGCHNNK